MSRPTTVTIDLAALAHNLQRVRVFAPASKVIAMVKANAYGHGLVEVAKTLTLADAFGVACMEEGMALREAGITQPIILMEGVFAASELHLAVQANFMLVIHHLAHLDMLTTFKFPRPVAVWLKINTGMNRLGFDYNTAQQVLTRLNSMSDCILQPIGIMSHFSNADDNDLAITLGQIAAFECWGRDLAYVRSMSNSAGIMRYPQAHYDWVRPGLMLYGASPFKGSYAAEYNLVPVMSLKSRIIALQQVATGEAVGYGGDWRAPQPSLIAVVGIGYGDGYPQAASSGTPVLIGDYECKLVGRVSMDMLAVDVTNCPPTVARLDQEVTLWGQGLPVERVAKFCNSSPYELLTRMTPRPHVNYCSQGIYTK